MIPFSLETLVPAGPRKLSQSLPVLRVRKSGTSSAGGGATAGSASFGFGCQRFGSVVTTGGWSTFDGIALVTVGGSGNSCLVSVAEGIAFFVLATQPTATRLKSKITTRMASHPQQSGGLSHTL